MVNKIKNRKQAGRMLADELLSISDISENHDLVLLALPRGGVPVGYEIASRMQLPLDLLLVRKLGVPNHEEYAMGAIALGGICVMNEEVVQHMHISHQAVQHVMQKERDELSRRNQIYRQGRSSPDVVGKTVVVIDDGLATGATMLAAVQALRKMAAGKVIVAVPVGAPTTVQRLEQFADQVICLYTPEPFYGVGAWYKNFSQTSDETVLSLLAQANSAAVGADRESRL